MIVLSLYILVICRCLVKIEQNHFAPLLITEVIPKNYDNVFCTLFSHEKSIKLVFIAFCRFMTVNKPQYGYFVDRNILSCKAGQLPCWYLVERLVRPGSNTGYVVLGNRCQVPLYLNFLFVPLSWRLIPVYVTLKYLFCCWKKH